MIARILRLNDYDRLSLAKIARETDQSRAGISKVGCNLRDFIGDKFLVAPGDRQASREWARKATLRAWEKRRALKAWVERSWQQMAAGCGVAIKLKNLLPICCQDLPQNGAFSCFLVHFNAIKVKVRLASI
jgi:hypothetical protein